RSVLFVSHNLSSILTLCKTGILLENGNLTHTGNIQDVINNYLSKNANSKNARIDLTEFKDREGTAELKFQEIFLSTTDKIETSDFLVGDDIILNFKLSSSVLKQVKVAIYLYRYDET